MKKLSKFRYFRLKIGRLVISKEIWDKDWKGLKIEVDNFFEERFTEKCFLRVAVINRVAVEEWKIRTYFTEFEDKPLKSFEIYSFIKDDSICGRFNFGRYIFKFQKAVLFDKTGKLFNKFRLEGCKSKKYGFYENGRLKTKHYVDSSLPCRVTAHYYPNGKLKSERHYHYYKFSLHRTDGPAVIEYYENGKVKKELYYFEGKIHRTDGPAVIEYDLEGNIKRKMFYLKGKKVSKKSFLKVLNQK